MRYYSMLMFVIAISGLDSWMCFQFDQDALQSLELNPICKRIIGRGGAELLVSTKVVGTATVVAVIQEMKSRSYRYREAVMYSLVAVQLLVLGSYVVYYLRL